MSTSPALQSRRHDAPLWSVRAWLTVEVVLYVSIVAVFWLVRYGQLFYLELPIYRPDWSGYAKVMVDILEGGTPDLTTRPPGFPLFVALALKTLGSHLYVIYAQATLRLIALLYLTFAAWRLHRGFGLLIAVSAIAVAGRYSGVELDSRMMSDSLYSSLIILAFAFIIRGLDRERWTYLAAASACAGYLILTKPAGHWALVTLALAWFAVMWNTRLSASRSAMALAIPALLLVGGLTVYNGVTTGTWRTSAYGGANIAGATWFYWHKSPDYRGHVNALIDTIQRNATDCKQWPRRCIDPQDIETLRTSSELRELSSAYGNLYGFWSQAWKFGLREFVFEHYGRSGHRNLKNIERMLYSLSLDAMAREPRLYVATVMASLYRLDFHFAHDRYAFDANRASKQLDRNTNFQKRGWVQDDPRLTLGEFGKKSPADIERRISLLREGTIPGIARLAKGYYETVHDRLFNSRTLGILFYPALVIAMIVLAFARGRHKGAAIALLVSSGALGASLIVALVEIGNGKYAEPTMILRYGAIASMALLFYRGRWERRDDAHGEHPPAEGAGRQEVLKE